MKDGASKSFEQAYNCQIASDEHAQIIVGTNVTQETNDKQQVKPVLEDVKERTGQTPQKASLDAGYYSDDNVAYLESEGIDGYIATGRQKHGEKIPPAPRGRIPKNATPKERMARKLRTIKGPGHVRQTQADCRTGVRADQRAPGLSTLFTAGPGQRHW